jgi:parvulin-like peptidyl-prolyl isomerase
MDRPLAFLRDEPVTWSLLGDRLIEARGGAVLAEVILDRTIAQRLAEAGMTITDAEVDAERDILAMALSDDKDQAARLLIELRQRRGLGDQRYASFLQRQAGLRKLIQPQVEVSTAAVAQAFQLEYGPKYEVRIIVTPTLADAGKVMREEQTGVPFHELAVRHSTDASRTQGGMLSPFSLVDSTYPAAIRAAVATLRVGSISQPVAIENGFALIKLERKIDAQDVKFDDVKEKLTLLVRRRVENLLMRQLERAMLDDANARLTILNPALKKSWDQQVARIGNEP